MAGYPPAYPTMVSMLKDISKIPYDNESTLLKCALHMLRGHVPHSHVSHSHIPAGHVTLSPEFMLYIKPPSTNSVRAVWVSWQRVRFLGETHRVQYCAGAKENEIFGTLKSFASNAL